MTLEEIVALLESDLSNEYAHWNFYMQAATNVRGLHRHELSEFFIEQAAGEMKHIEQFRRLIQGLKTRNGIAGEIPSSVAPFKSNISDPREILAAALEMEDKVVHNYVLRHEQAEQIASVDGTCVSLFLEDQILDSRGDADDILEMLQGGY